MSSSEVLLAGANVPGHGDGPGDDRVRLVRTGPIGGDRGGVVVCDGVGSLEGSGVVAESVAELVSDRITEVGPMRAMRTLPGKLFRHKSPNDSGATTVLAIAAENGEVWHAHVGNGSLIEVQNVGPSGRTWLRWLELAHPHISWETGRDALSSVVPSLPTGLETAIGYRWSPPSRPRMFVACSDGIASPEQVREVSMEGDPRSWRLIPSRLVAVIETISSVWQDLLRLPAGEAEELLHASLESALERLRVAGELDDDATIAVMLLRPTREKDESE